MVMPSMATVSADADDVLRKQPCSPAYAGLLHVFTILVPSPIQPRSAPQHEKGNQTCFIRFRRTASTVGKNHTLGMRLHQPVLCYRKSRIPRPQRHHLPVEDTARRWPMPPAINRFVESGTKESRRSRTVIRTHPSRTRTNPQPPRWQKVQQHLKSESRCYLAICPPMQQRTQSQESRRLPNTTSFPSLRLLAFLVVNLACTSG